MKSAILTLLALFVSSSLSGCGIYYTATYTVSRLDTLTPSMSKEEVLQTLGEPDYVRIDDGEMLLWEYNLYGKNESLRSLAFCPFTVLFACVVPPGDRRKDPYWVVLVDERLCMWGNPDVVSTRKKCKPSEKQITESTKRDGSTSATIPVSVLPVYMPPPINAKVNRLAILPLSDTSGYALPTILDLVLNILRNRHQDLVLVERDLRPVLTEVTLQYSGRVSDESTVRVGRLAGADTLLVYKMGPFSESAVSSVVNSGGVISGTVEVKLMSVEKGTLLFRQQAMGSSFLPAPGPGRSWPSTTLQTAHRNAVNIAGGYALVALLAAFGDNSLGIVPNITSGGAEIYGILDASPAQRAGIMKGDRVLAVNGQDISSWTTLMPLTLPTVLKIEREGKQKEISVMKP